MPNVKAICAGGMLTVGAVLLGYAIFFSGSDKDLPGWEPVNKHIEQALAPLPTARSTTSSQRAGIPPVTPPTAPQVAPPVKPAAAESQTPAPAEAQPPAAVESETPVADSVLLDLNTATQSQLEDLPGIGASKAMAIIAYREQNGAFKTVNQLLGVKGIGPKMLEKLAPFVTAGAPGKG